MIDASQTNTLSRNTKRIHDYLFRPKITIPPPIYDHLSKAAVTIYYCTSTVLMGRVIKLIFHKTYKITKDLQKIINTYINI